MLTVRPPTEPSFLPSFIEATGNATHLGLFTLEIPHVVNTATRIATGTFEFTAANGDTLTAEFVGVATVIGPGVLSTADTGTRERFLYPTAASPDRVNEPIIGAEGLCVAALEHITLRDDPGAVECVINDDRVVTSYARV